MTQDSDPLTHADIGIVKLLLMEGFQQKRIAALFDVNQGRISEINSGSKYKQIPVHDQLCGDGSIFTYPLKKKGNER